MPSKSISITDEVYELLDKYRINNESFSQAILRLIRTKTNLMDLEGAWKKIPDIGPAIDLIEKTVESIRENKRKKNDPI